MSQQLAPKDRKRLWSAFLPVAVFAVLALIFVKGLITADPSKIPSALIGKPVHDFSLPPLAGLISGGTEIKGLATDDLKSGSVTLVNIWASWCAPCRQEHPLLMQLSKDSSIKLTGINYKDKPENALRFLSSLGNPYALVGVDVKGNTAIDWGVYGVPETFVIDGKGIIRHKLIGPLTPERLKLELLPQIRAAQSPPAS